MTNTLGLCFLLYVSKVINMFHRWCFLVNLLVLNGIMANSYQNGKQHQYIGVEYLG